MYAQKEAVWGGAPPYRNHFIGSASSGRSLNPLSKTDSQLTMLSLGLLACCLTNFDFRLPDSATKRPSAIYHLAGGFTCLQVLTQRNFNIWSRKNSKQTSFERHHSPEQPTNQEGHPQSDVTRRRRAGFLQPGKETKQQDLRSPQLKASIKRNLYFAGTGRTNLKE